MIVGPDQDGSDSDKVESFPGRGMDPTEMAGRVWRAMLPFAVIWVKQNGVELARAVLIMYTNNQKGGDDL